MGSASFLRALGAPELLMSWKFPLKDMSERQKEIQMGVLMEEKTARAQLRGIRQHPNPRKASRSPRIFLDMRSSTPETEARRSLRLSFLIFLTFIDAAAANKQAAGTELTRARAWSCWLRTQTLVSSFASPSGKALPSRC